MSTQLTQPHARVLPDVTQDSTLAVSISPLQETYTIGDDLRLHVEVQNVGQVPIYVGNRIPTHDWLYHLDFTVKDREGKLSDKLYFFHPQMSDNMPKEDSTVALTKNWIVLQPGYFFGTTLDIPSGFFESLKKPGEYTIQGIYSCDGMETEVNYNQLAKDKKFLEGLAYRSWKGAVKTNVVKIRMVSPGAH